MVPGYPDPGSTMDHMGSFRIEVALENPAAPGPRAHFQSVLVDTGAELSWFPASALEALGVERRKELQFRQADGSVLTRWSGWAEVHAAGTVTVDEVVFGEPRDMVLLGARTLGGLNLRVDPMAKRLIDAGPLPAAVAALASYQERIDGGLESVRAKADTQEDSTADVGDGGPGHVVAVRALSAYRRHVRFADGAKGVVNASRLIVGTDPCVIVALGDPEVFAKVRLELGAGCY